MIQLCAPMAYPSFVRMGRNGRALVAERYTWAAVTKAVVAGYNNILK